MRVHRSIQILTIVTTIAACSSPGQTADATPVAAAPAAAPTVEVAAAPDPVAVNVNWDSGPLDRAYHTERVALDARHAREVASPIVGESATLRVQRQANENQALELRYTQGKTAHARVMPPAAR